MRDRTRVWGALSTFVHLFVSVVFAVGVPLVIGLSAVSGATTYYGMMFFLRAQDWWMGMVVTVAVQAIIVLGAFELSRSHLRANAWRKSLLGMWVLAAFCVSVFFSYAKFYETFEHDTEMQRRFGKIREQITGYVAQANAAADEYVDARRDARWEESRRIEDRLNEAALVARAAVERQEGEVRRVQEKLDAIEQGIYPGLPMRLRFPGRGPAYRAALPELRRAQDDLERLRAKAAAAEEAFRNAVAVVGTIDPEDQGKAAGVRDRASGLRTWLEHLGWENLDEVQHRLLHEALATVTTGLQQLGRNDIAEPPVMTHAQYVDSRPSIASLVALSPLPFLFALLIDFFTLVLSHRLEVGPPITPLHAQQRRAVFEGLCEFRDWSLNCRGLLQISLRKTEWERQEQYNESFRTLMAALVINRGYARLIDASTIECDASLSSVLVEEALVDRISDPTSRAA